MELRFKRKQKTLVIQMEGELDHHTSVELRRQIGSAWAEMGGRNLVFDFLGVTFMDSSGIGVMIGRYKETTALGGRIAIANPNEKIREIIRLSGLSRLLPVFDTVAEAIAYAEGREGDAV